jgi:hypothetical protein
MLADDDPRVRHLVDTHTLAELEERDAYLRGEYKKLLDSLPQLRDRRHQVRKLGREYWRKDPGGLPGVFGIWYDQCLDLEEQIEICEKAIELARTALPRPTIDPVSNPIRSAPEPDPDSPLGQFDRLIRRYKITEIARRVGVAPSTLHAWRATEQGKQVSRPLKTATRNKIVNGILQAAEELDSPH